jgi:hypothetical protein
MPKRLFDRLALFLRARLDVAIVASPVGLTQRRYAVNLLDVRDPSRFRNEAVVTLHELLNLGVRGHFMSSTIVPSCMKGQDGFVATHASDESSARYSAELRIPSAE